MQPRALVLVGSLCVLAGTFALDWRLAVLALGVLMIGFAVATAAGNGRDSAPDPGRPPPGPPPATRTRPAYQPGARPSPWSPPEPADRAGDPLARRDQPAIGGHGAKQAVPDAERPHEAAAARV